MDGKDIRETRQRLNLTQEALGGHFGVTRNTIARWERGEVIPQWPKLLRLAFRALELEAAAISPRLLEQERQVVARTARNRNRLEGLAQAVTRA